MSTSVNIGPSHQLGFKPYDKSDEESNWYATKQTDICSDHHGHIDTVLGYFKHGSNTNGWVVWSNRR